MGGAATLEELGWAGAVVSPLSAKFGRCEEDGVGVIIASKGNSNLIIQRFLKSLLVWSVQLHTHWPLCYWVGCWIAEAIVIQRHA